MAKKQETKTEVESTPQVAEQPKVETMVMETPKPKRKEPTSRIINDWEIKDRTYILTSGKQPLSYSFRSKGLFHFDEEKGYEREIQYAVNQSTPFVDEFKGQIRPGRIVFRNGAMVVPKEKVTLQKFLSIYHPFAGKSWEEVKPVVAAATELETLDLQLDAMIAARSMDIELIEAIMRTEIGSGISEMTSKELKRDALVFAKKNPKLFLSLMKDGNIHLRNLGIKAVEQGILTLSSDQRTVFWTSTNRKLMSVPFEEHPYSALAAWFKTDEGMEVLQSVEKQLK